MDGDFFLLTLRLEYGQRLVNQRVDIEWGEIKLDLTGLNGQPTVSFDGNDFLTSSLWVGQNYSLFVVGQLTGTQNGRLVSSSTDNSLIGWHGGYQDQLYGQNWVSQTNGTVQANTPILYTATDVAGSGTLYKNGNALAATGSTFDGWLGKIQLSGAQGANSESSKGAVSELLVFDHVLSAGEQRCLEALTRSFLESHILWQQIEWVVSHGRMWLRRDRAAIFHGCIPVDERGDFLAMTVDGAPRKGRELLEALDAVVHRAVRRRDPADIDLVFYLWTGPLSPCFGKDRMATFETYFVADKATHEERKNPYFTLLQDAAFCRKVLAELGIADGWIVNGHVPVKLDAGETAIKKSHMAITIDGAFAAAYGDKGFSLVLGADRMYLAQHHHFAGEGDDIVPTVSDVEVYDQPRTIGVTLTGKL